MTMIIPENQIRALIRLLSDEDDRIVQTISGKLILEEIRGGKLEEELAEQAGRSDDAMSLETGAFIIARYAYPSLDVARYREQLDTMAREVRDRIGSRASGEETVNALNRYVFAEQGFKGNTKNYYEVENSYVNCVIDRRVGIPISLSVVYLLIGHRLALPLFGIGMPGHFLVKYESERYKIFIDCFNGGALLTEKNCARFLTEAGYGFDEKYLQKSPTRAILSRMLKNLVAIYSKMDEPVKTARLTKFIEILGGEPREEGL
jgi:regulator of sirC expression with transglutaminase-like and TPR domain